MGEVFDFQKQKRAGKIATKVAELHLLMKPGIRMVESVEDAAEYRTRGIDLLVWAEGKDPLEVEVKADSYPKTKNLFLEVNSDIERGTLGCFLTSQASHWLYFFTHQDRALWIPLGPAREWFLRERHRFQERDVQNKGWRARGVLTPVAELVKAQVGVEVFTGVWEGVRADLDERWEVAA